MKAKFKIHGTVQAPLLSSFLQRRLGAASIVLDRIAELGADDPFLRWGGRNSGNGVFLLQTAPAGPGRQDAREVKIGSRQLCIRRLSKSDSSGTRTRVPGAVQRRRQRWASTGDWRLSQTALTKSLAVAVRKRGRRRGEVAMERRGEERSSATKYESWRAGLGKRKIARQSIIPSTGNNLLGGRLLPAPPLQTWVRWAARVQARYRGGHQGTR